MTRIAVKIAYLGNSFFGSQRQPGSRTVEREICYNLEAVCNMPEGDIDLKLASRTDKDVNALGNVAVFNTNFEDFDVLLKALNAVSWGVYYRSYAIVPDDFNIRYANLRMYRYIMPSEGIDIGRAQRCASLFLGEHDFLRFTKPNDKITLGNIVSADVWTSGELMIFDCSAVYFLWHQVRRMMSAIAAVGRGDAENEDVLRALDGEDISFGIARADALTLRDVVFRDIEFIVPDETMFDRRIKEELFSSKLRESFFTSL